MMRLGSNFKGVVHSIHPGDRRNFVSVLVDSVCSVLFPLSKFLTFLILTGYQNVLSCFNLPKGHCKCLFFLFKL